MTDSLNIWVVLYACGFVMGIFMALLFAVSHAKYPKHVQNITITFLILSFLLFSEIAEESNLVDSYPALLNLGTIADLLIWPFVLFYVQYLAGKRKTYHWHDVLYFLPFLFGLLSQIPFFQLSANEKLTYYHAGIPAAVAWLVAFKMVVSVAFLGYMLNLLRGGVATTQNSRQSTLLIQGKRFFAGILAIMILIYLSFFNHYFELMPLGDSDRFSSLVVSVLFYFFGIVIFRNPEMLAEETYSRQVKEFFENAEEPYAQRLIDLFEKQKVYLNEKLSVKDIAAALGLTNQQVSFLLNRQMDSSFLDFVNSYRVKEVQRKMEQDDLQAKTILALAMESGFNSKASFNRIFKNHTGLSPSAYLKNRRGK